MSDDPDILQIMPAQPFTWLTFVDDVGRVGESLEVVGWALVRRFYKNSADSYRSVDALVLDFNVASLIEELDGAKDAYVIVIGPANALDASEHPDVRRCSDVRARLERKRQEQAAQ